MTLDFILSTGPTGPEGSLRFSDHDSFHQYYIHKHLPILFASTLKMVSECTFETTAELSISTIRKY
jgi:hypothetical protein